ncbi:MAG: hypothetical protein EXR98_05875 [Gemmataceae bacterium]|nr:hypothetical protein [Gemmataceae bacterium]
MIMKSFFAASLATILLASVLPVHAQQLGKVQIKKTKDALEFSIDDDLVTRYLIGADRPKPIFWPVNAPGGVPLTRSWPMEKAQPGEAIDHPHQQSAWFCHGDLIPEGIELPTKIKGVAGVDFWSIAKGHGKMVVTAVGDPKNAPGHGSVVTKNEWSTAEGTKIMDETRAIHLYATGKARLIVVQCDLHATVCNLTFGDTKEGAFGIRINDVINAGKTGKGKIQNAEGKIGEKECWGQVSAWCDYSGPVGGKEVGLTVLVDPKNPHPTCWHVRGYGLMAANPFGRDKHAKFPAVKGNNELVRLKKGEHLVLRYGMLLHEGDAVSGQVEGYYQRFVKLRDK